MIIHWVVLLCSLQLLTNILDRLLSTTKVLTENGINYHATRVTLYAK